MPQCSGVRTGGALNWIVQGEQQMFVLKGFRNIIWKGAMLLMSEMLLAIDGRGGEGVLYVT